MKKTKIIIIFILCFANFCSAQFLKPEKTVAFYFEDAKMNKDTVYVGMDNNASDNSMEPFFGEKDITYKDWKPLLEVRAGFIKNEFSSVPYPLSKIRVTNGTCDLKNNFHFYAFTENTLYFRCDNLPLKVSWDTTIFEDACWQNSYFHRFAATYKNGLSEEERILLKDQNGNYLITQQYLDDTKKKYWSGTYDYFSTDGAKVYGFHFFTVPKGGKSGSSATHELESAVLKYSPNPASDKLTIQLDNTIANANLQIVGANGQILQQKDIPNGTTQLEIDVSALVNGLYFMQVRTASGQLYSNKFIKIE